jgi:hypothetical protein
MDDYDIKLLANEELRQAIKIKRLNEQLLEHLHSTLIWAIRYCRKNNIPLPNEHIMKSSLEKAEKYLQQMPYSSPTKVKQPDKTTEDESVPYFR